MVVGQLEHEEKKREREKPYLCSATMTLKESVSIRARAVRNLVLCDKHRWSFSLGVDKSRKGKKKKKKGEKINNKPYPFASVKVGVET